MDRIFLSELGFIGLRDYGIFLSPSADKLRVKAGRTWWVVRLQGHSKYLQKGRECANEVGQLFAARGSGCFAG
jgi:hypothetical protein